MLYGVYDKLNMGADVMMLLINYCRRQERLSARFLEKTAYEWHDRGVANYQAASELLDEIDRRQSQYGRVLSLFGITNRAPSESEKKYIAAWLEMGHSDDLIRMAYDRTVLRTGKLTWRYLHRILEEWKNKGYKTRRQVEAAEGSLASQSPVPEKPKEESAAATCRATATTSIPAAMSSRAWRSAPTSSLPCSTTSSGPGCTPPCCWRPWRARAARSAAPSKS